VGEVEPGVEPDPELTFLIDPVDVKTGAALLTGFLGIAGDLLGRGTEEDRAMTDVTVLSFGGIIPKDPEAPTEWELGRQAKAQALFEQAEQLRAEELFEVTQAAFFWQVQGGSLDAAESIAGGGEDAYPKALNLLAQRSGLEIFAILASTGSSSGSETSPTAVPATSTPPSSAS
jgi:hypothetical protein